MQEEQILSLVYTKKIKELENKKDISFTKLRGFQIFPFLDDSEIKIRIGNYFWFSLESNNVKKQKHILAKSIVSLNYSFFLDFNP